MSTSQAIAGITIVLENIITRGVIQELDSGVLGKVTTKPLDKAREGELDINQINIFLYQTSPNTAWRNQDMPNRVKPGETGKPPLALNLYYLITAYGKDNDEIESHRLLGVATRVLHDHPLIGDRDIEAAMGSLKEEKKKILEASDLKKQVERISVTPITLSLEELSKLWGTFQTQYRISASYQVSVVLIESKLPVKTPLPLLSRGSDGQGLSSQTGLIPPLPSLTGIKLPEKQYYFTVGYDLILEGYNLEDSVAVHCEHPHLKEPIILKRLEAVSDKQIRVNLRDNGQWLAGFYRVTVQVKEEGRDDRVTNALTFPLVPELTIPKREVTTKLIITSNLPVQEGQLVALLLSDREIPYQFPAAAQPKILPFDVSNVTPDTYVVRLRVDGVDSVPIDFETQPPTFKDNQKVEIKR